MTSAAIASTIGTARGSTHGSWRPLPSTFTFSLFLVTLSWGRKIVATVPIEKILPVNDKSFIENALLKAQEKCFAVGLTSVHDAGLDKHEIFTIKSLQDASKLKMRIYQMINGSDSNMQYFFAAGRIKTPQLNVRSVKYYADGALG